MDEKKNVKNNSKKENFMNNKFVKSYRTFYIENLKKKHIIISVIMLVIFFVMLSFFLNNSISIKEVASGIVEKTFSDNIIKEKIPLLAIIIFSGITPYFFLPVLGIMGSGTLALEVCCTYFVNESIFSIILGSLGSIIQIIAISLCVATGIYYCIQSTKKFRYSQHMSFGLKDVKKEIYVIRKDEEKLKKLQETETKKAKEREKLNVKIPYINLFISFIISTIILILGLIISSIM